MRMLTFLVGSAATAALLVGSTVTPGDAFDLTGHWVGKWTCKGFDGAKFSDRNDTSTLDITQSGAAIHAKFEHAFPYDGVAIPDAKKPEKGEAVIIDCHTNAVLAADGNSEIIRAPVATKGPKGVLKGLSILENDVAPFGEEVQTCKYAYHRVDTNDPGIGSCP